MKVRCSLLCGAHCCTPFPSTLTYSRTVGSQHLPSWSSQRPKLNITREGIKIKSPTANLSQRMNILSVCRSMSSPSERVRILNASLERILKAKVNVIRKDKVHWVSALLHWPHFPQPDIPPSRRPTSLRFVTLHGPNHNSVLSLQI
jgi:hypothetical protein